MVERVLKERYAIQQSLGKNAGRQTFLARDLQTQQLVVVKILTFSADFHWDDLKLFKREAATLQSLSHPGIPSYLDYFEFETPTTKCFALVQSYIKAQSLAEWVEAGRSFNEAEIKLIAKRLLEILLSLQQQNPPVIHRDIKPSNILLAERSPVKQHSALNNSGWLGEVYLVDFGSVQTLAAREGSTVTVVGTYGYMPPEQFGGRAVPASDLYGLGATLIYLLTGVHPADLPQEDLRINFEPKIAVSWDFVDWLQWMTEPDLNSRLTTAHRALQALEKPKQRGRSLLRNPRASNNVKLNKDRKSLEIVISTFSPLFLVSVFLVIPLIASYRVLLVSISWIVLAFTNGSFIGGLFAAFGVTYLGSFCLFLLFQPIKLVFLRRIATRLLIDEEQIYFTSNFRGFLRYNMMPPSPRQAICKLQFIRDKYTYSSLGRNIQIWAGTREYQLITSHLTDDEIDWIAGELSQWLNLPISE